MADTNALVVSLATREMQHQHPLSQIAVSGMHQLLLKQWLKEEDLLARRVAQGDLNKEPERDTVAVEDDAHLPDFCECCALRHMSGTEVVLEQLPAWEHEDVLLLGKCVTELKCKGFEFDL
ncbi:uncharacterized protein LOC133904548 [Phragmites australis]|uniref:uncharacterized protein LOC133904548 n=1 Tax=Phragmites australis TaxID=29695 RepID=UPI002D78C813|nr:uncharacterized protein LOC133904548 [Phragmites australis]